MDDRLILWSVGRKKHPPEPPRMNGLEPAGRLLVAIVTMARRDAVDPRVDPATREDAAGFLHHLYTERWLALRDAGID